jgi:hypothetical protein
MVAQATLKRKRKEKAADGSIGSKQDRVVAPLESHDRYIDEVIPNRRLVFRP